MFRKKKKPETGQSSPGKRRKLEEDDGEVVDDVDLATLKQLQKERKGRSGVQTDLVHLGQSATLKAEKPDDKPDDGKDEVGSLTLKKQTLAVERAGGLQNVAAKFGLRSGGQGYKLSEKELLEQEAMERYVAEQLKKDGEMEHEGSSSVHVNGGDGLFDNGGLKTGLTTAAERRKQLAEEEKKRMDSAKYLSEQLYELPERLKTSSTLYNVKEKNINWTTGIVEVEVDAGTRIKNIVDAEEAKKKALAKLIAKGESGDLLSGEISSKAKEVEYDAKTGKMKISGSLEDGRKADKAKMDKAWGGGRWAGLSKLVEEGGKKDQTDEEMLRAIRAGGSGGGRGKILWPDQYSGGT